ncbi:hypothetical protein PIB30_061418 [Stylosanthes scabra]|uniref:Uncharacterized protein n=1 Tax=Stylosanthes scabra TaxID=79078 RepID=A0ABU6XLR4_9FABA|nr:hypothetical protein [Stylosanthes scabra]
MVAREFYLGQSLVEEESTLLHEQEDYDSLLLEEGEDDDEALSLCDLPLYSNNSSSSTSSSSADSTNNHQRVRDDDVFLSTHGKKTSSSRFTEKDDDDFFEFFSEEFTASTTHSKTTISDNIIFCGKLIPYKEAGGGNNNNNNKEEDNNNIIHQKSTLVHPWNSKKGGKKAKEGEKSNFNYEYPSIGKVSLMRSTTKSRWFLFMFGMPRLPNNNAMDLSGIRYRQSRSRSQKTMFAVVAPPPENGEEVKKGKRYNNKNNNNCKGLWRALKSISFGLGCRSSKLANDVVVKAAFGPKVKEKSPREVRKNKEIKENGQKAKEPNLP